MWQQPIWAAHAAGESTFAFQLFFSGKGKWFVNGCNPTEQLHLENVTQWSLPIALRDDYLAPMDFCQEQKGRNGYIEPIAKLESFEGHTPLPNTHWSSREKIGVFLGRYYPAYCLFNLFNISFYVIDQHNRSIALTHPFCGWFQRTRQDTKQ